MQILQVYDQTLSFRETARVCGCSPSTVIAKVQDREAGLHDRPITRKRTSIVDPYRDKIAEMVSDSSGKVRARVVHRTIAGMGFAGSRRTTRTAVAAARKAYLKQNRRVFKPWITEPGRWAQFDWADGPVVDGQRSYLFCAWLSWSRYRVVLPVRDRKRPATLGCLAESMAIFGGAPRHWLTDNQRVVTPGRIASLPIKHQAVVRFARHYGTTIELCEPFDPQSKGGSERTVALAKADIVPTAHNLLPDYRSWSHLADACDEFTRQVNSRPHRSTGEAPIEMLARERDSLLTLPARPYAGELGQQRAPDSSALISWKSVQYSVPDALVGETVWVREQGDQLIVAATGGDAGLREVARHRLARSGRVVDDDHYPDHDTPGPIERKPKPRNQAEREFLAIGPGAGVWLKAAADAGAARLTEKMAQIVDLARLEESEMVNAALELAAECERFGFDDIGSIVAAAASQVRYRPSEDAFLQQGTLAWKDFGATGGERGA